MGKSFLTSEGVQEKGRYSKVRPNVWTKPTEEKEHGGPWKTNTHVVHHRKHEQEDGGRREAEIEEQISFLPVGHASRFENVVQQETRKGMQELEQQKNQQAQEQNEGLKSLESLVTENRMDQTEEATRVNRGQK